MDQTQLAELTVGRLLVWSCISTTMFSPGNKLRHGSQPEDLKESWCNHGARSHTIQDEDIMEEDSMEEGHCKVWKSLD